MLQVCAGSEEIHQIATKCIFFGVCPLGKREASAHMQLHIQTIDGREEEVYPGLETAAVDEIRMARPERRSWSDVVVCCINPFLYFRLLRVLKVKLLLKYLCCIRALICLNQIFFLLYT